MKLASALRLVGVLLAVIAVGSALVAVYSTVGLMVSNSGPDGSMGLLVLFMAETMQSAWQTIAGAAMALLCFAAARLLDGMR